MARKLTVPQKKKRLKKLLDIIFKEQPCVVCKSLGRINTQTCAHHVVSKGSNVHWKWEIRNLIPLCNHHHLFDIEINAHSRRGNSMEVGHFWSWLEKNLPIHHQWAEDNCKVRGKRYADDWDVIIKELEFFVENPMEAENLVFERN